MSKMFAQFIYSRYIHRVINLNIFEMSTIIFLFVLGGGRGKKGGGFATVSSSYKV